MKSESDLSASVEGLSSARRIALVYAAVAGLWIIASGAALQALPVGREAERVLEEVKGIGFVVVTATALFVVLRRHFQRLQTVVSRLDTARVSLADYAAFPRLSPHPIVAFNARGEVTWANPAAGEGSGQVTVSSLLPGDVPGIIQQCTVTGAVEGIHHVAAGRKWVWSFFPNSDGTRVYAYGTDRSHEVRLESQLARTARMESVGRLASGLAHDFNNVLTAINGLSELLAEDLPSGDERAADVADIRDATRKGAELVRQLMLLGRERPAEQHAVDLNTEIQHLLPLLRHLLPGGVTLAFHRSQGAAVVMFNSGELEQVLMNLVSNAGDAMPGGGAVTISTSTTVTDGGERLVISVADTGAGIPAAILADIFDPFFTTNLYDEAGGQGDRTRARFGVQHHHRSRRHS